MAQLLVSSLAKWFRGIDMNKLIANGVLRNQIVANHAGRQAFWNKNLITNDKGIVTNAQGALKYDEYKELTDDVIKTREFPQVGAFYRSFIGAGLSRPMDIGKTVIDYKDMNAFGDATVSMDAANRENEQNNYDQRLVPLPIFHKDFVIPWRQTGFSYKERIYPVRA